MATVNLGRIKPVFKSTWANGTTYAVDDFVVHGNECYICIQAGAGQNPTSASSYWTKIAAKGTDGTDVGATLTTQGDILYRDGSGLARLGYGTAGQLLTTGGSGANPSWTTVDSGGVIQTKFYSTGNSFTYASNSYGNLGSLSVAITPTSASNKILLFFQCGSAQGNDSGNNTTNIRFYNGSAGVVVGNSNGSRDQAGSRITGANYSSPNHADNHTMFGIDSPNSTSAITYTVQCRNESGTSYWGRAQNYANDNEVYNATFRTTFMVQEIKQ